MQDEIAQRLVEIADELRALGQNGLFWANKRHEEYDYARYAKAVELASRLISIVDTRDAAEIERIYLGELDVRSPLVGIGGAVFDEQGRLLLTQRADNKKWCLPGGLSEIGESPAEVVAREVREETGLQVKAIQLIGVFDSRKLQSTFPVHFYNIDFICERLDGKLGLSNETIAFGYFTEAEAAALDMHRSHAIRVPIAFQCYRSEQWQSVFQ